MIKYLHNSVEFNGEIIIVTKEDNKKRWDIIEISLKRELLEIAQISIFQNSIKIIPKNPIIDNSNKIQSLLNEKSILHKINFISDKINDDIKILGTSSIIVYGKIPDDKNELIKFLNAKNEVLKDKISDKISILHFKYENQAAEAYKIINEHFKYENYSKKLNNELLYAEPNFDIVFKRKDLINSNLIENNIIEYPNGYYNRDALKLINYELNNSAKNVIVSILDEGVEVKHKGLNYFDAPINIDYTDNHELEDEESHGTSCAGLVGGFEKFNDSKPTFTGIARNCKILCAKILKRNLEDNTHTTNIGWIIKAIKDCIDKKSRIFSCSWHLPENLKSLCLENIISKYSQSDSSFNGALFVFSAGNNESSVSYPGSLDSVITVGGTDSYGNYITKKNSNSWHSNKGPEINIAAPSKLLVSTDLSGTRGSGTGQFLDIISPDYTYFSGTSAAVPLVSGAIALMIAKNPSLKSETIRDLLSDKNNVTIPNNWQSNQGVGILNIKKLINQI